METKICNTCNTCKCIDQFTKRNDESYHNRCKECTNKYAKKI